MKIITNDILLRAKGLGSFIVLSSILASCSVGQTGYSGQDSIYYNSGSRRVTNIESTGNAGYVYNNKGISSNEKNSDTEVRIGKKYIDPNESITDLLYDDNNNNATTSGVARSSHSQVHSYSENNTDNGWGDDTGTVINNYYYNTNPYAYPYNSYWNGPYYNYWGGYYPNYWGWNISIGWNWGWPSWGWNDYWGRPGWGYPWGWNWRPYPNYWRYPNYGPRRMAYGQRSSSYIGRSYGAARVQQVNRNNRYSQPRTGSIGGNRVGNGNFINGNNGRGTLNQNNPGRTGSIKNGQIGTFDNPRAGNINNSNAGSRGGVIRGDRGNSGIINGTRQSSGISTPRNQISNPGSFRNFPASPRAGSMGSGSIGGSRGGSIGGARR